MVMGHIGDFHLREIFGFSIHVMQVIVSCLQCKSDPKNIIKDNIFNNYFYIISKKKCIFACSGGRMADLRMWNGQMAGWAIALW